jgi:hypothetical protein
MAVAPCRECGENVSSLAEACPHCGFKNRVQPKRGFFWFLSSLFSGVVVVIGMMGGLILIRQFVVPY